MATTIEKLRCRLIIHAPNVHTGGGLVLLKSILLEWPDDISITLILDSRVSSKLQLPIRAKVLWVKATPLSRLRAEIYLSYSARQGGTILCFHGLPPIFPTTASVHVFLQNRLYIETIKILDYKFSTGIRILFERTMNRMLRNRVDKYIVQTQSMEVQLRKWYRKFKNDNRQPAIRVVPFAETLTHVHLRCTPLLEWDFVYVADGEAHKNHRTLLEAWILLANEGIRSSLVLTLAKHNVALMEEVEKARSEYGLRIMNLGQIPHEEILTLYSKAKTLIYPSLIESFGLPLIEASQLGLPILAPELDYVRDVCVPVQTFDANSAVSIARAVKRHLGYSEPVLPLYSPAEFLQSVLEPNTER